MKLIILFMILSFSASANSLKEIDLSEAVRSLMPNAEFSIDGENIDSIKWNDLVTQKPTKAQILAEMGRLQALQNEKNRILQARAKYPLYELIEAISENDSTKLEQVKQQIRNLKNN
jgi:hypothetical protein